MHTFEETDRPLSKMHKNPQWPQNPELLQCRGLDSNSVSNKFKTQINRRKRQCTKVLVNTYWLTRDVSEPKGYIEIDPQ